MPKKRYMTKNSKKWMYLDTGNEKQDAKREVKKRKIMTRELVG